MSRVISLAVLSLSLGVLNAQPAEKWCVADGEDYKQIFESNVGALRWSLFGVSELNVVERKLDPALLTRLTDEAVISLANTLSLRAQTQQKCDLAKQDYEQQIQGNEDFATVFFAITSSEQFPASDLMKRNHESLLLLADPQTVIANQDKDRPMPFSIAVYNRLDAWVAQKTDQLDPYYVAVNKLLGKDVVWDEQKIKPAAIVPMSPNKLLSGSPINHLFGLLASDAAVAHDFTAILLENLETYFASSGKDSPTNFLH